MTPGEEDLHFDRLLLQHLLELKLCTDPNSHEVDVDHLHPVVKLDVPRHGQWSDNPGKVSAKHEGQAVIWAIQGRSETHAQ